MSRTASAFLLFVLMALTATTAISLRPAPTPARPQLAVASPKPTCKPGYVWREAHRNDLVCVTPESRDRVAWENRHWIVHTLQGGNACAPGFVWRGAFVGDFLCVTTEVRAAVREENFLAESRRVAVKPASCADAVAPANLALLPAGEAGHSKDGLDAEDRPGSAFPNCPSVE